MQADCDRLCFVTKQKVGTIWSYNSWVRSRWRTTAATCFSFCSFRCVLESNRSNGFETHEHVKRFSSFNQLCVESSVLRTKPYAKPWYAKSRRLSVNQLFLYLWRFDYPRPKCRVKIKEVHLLSGSVIFKWKDKDKRKWMTGSQERMTDFGCLTGNLTLTASLELRRVISLPHTKFICTNGMYSAIVQCQIQT